MVFAKEFQGSWVLFDVCLVNLVLRSLAQQTEVAVAVNYDEQDEPQAYDARVYNVCAPWAGGRGDSFIRVFQPECLNGLDSISDDWSTIRAHAEDRDMGGDPNLGGVAIGPPLNANEQRQARRARSNRADKLKSLLHKHITSTAIHGEIDAAAVEVRGYEAAVLAAGGPLAAAAAAIPLPPAYARYEATGFLAG